MMKAAIENNFNLVMLASIVIGLFFPGLELLPKSTLMVIVAIVIFFSCSKVSLQELKEINKTTALIFYIARFLCLPFIALYTANILAPEFAVGVFLMTLMPSGVSSTAVTTICKGNTSLALAMTVFSHLIVPFAAPIALFWGIGKSIEINRIDMLMTLCLAVFVPSVTYFASVRRLTKIKVWTQDYAQFYAILFTGAMVAVALAMQKDIIFSSPQIVMYALLANLILFAAFYILPWVGLFKAGPSIRKTLTISSGANNNGLSIGLAALYFSPVTLLFCVISEIIWVIGVAAFEKFASKKF